MTADKKRMGLVLQLAPWLAVVGCALVGLVALLIGAWETQSILEYIHTLAPDRNASRFDLLEIAAMQTRSIVVGLVWLLVALLFALLSVLHREPLASFLTSTPDRRAPVMARMRQFIREERLHAGVMAAFTVVAFILALRSVDQPMRCDEAGTFLGFVSRPWFYAISVYVPNNHILYSLMAKLSCALIWSDSLCVRLPALFAGVLIVPAVYLAMRRHFGRSVALLAAAAMSSSTYAIDFATNGRGYTTVTLCFLVLLAVTPRLVEPRAGRYWVVFVIVSALGFFTVPTMAYPFAIVVTWLLIAVIRELPRRWTTLWAEIPWSVVATTAFVCALYSPAFVVSGLESVVSNEAIETNRLESRALLVVDFFQAAMRLWDYWSYDQPMAVALLLASGVLAGLALARRIGRSFVDLLLATVVGMLCVLIATRALPPKWVLSFLFPVYLGLSTAGLLALVRLMTASWPLFADRAATLLAVALCLMGARSLATAARPGSVPWYVGYPNAADVAGYFGKTLQPGDRIEAHNVVVPPVLFYMAQAGDPDPYFWVRPAGSDDRAIYFVESGHKEIPENLHRLRRLGVTGEEVVFELPDLRILRLIPPPGWEGAPEAQATRTRVNRSGQPPRTHGVKLAIKRRLESER